MNNLIFFSLLILVTTCTMVGAWEIGRKFALTLSSYLEKRKDGD